MRVRVLAFDAQKYVADLENTIEKLGEAQKDLNHSRQRSSRYYVRPMKSVETDGKRVAYWREQLNKLHERTAEGSSIVQIVLADRITELEDMLDSIPADYKSQWDDLYDKFTLRTFRLVDNGTATDMWPTVKPIVAYVVMHLRSMKFGSPRAREVFVRAINKLDKLENK